MPLIKGSAQNEWKNIDLRHRQALDCSTASWRFRSGHCYHLPILTTGGELSTLSFQLPRDGLVYTQEIFAPLGT